MEKEGRILAESRGNNTDQQINYRPKMPWESLLKGYNKVMTTIYAPKYFYQRVKEFLQEYNPPKGRKLHPRLYHLPAFFKALFIIGIWGEERSYFWRLIGWSLFKKPQVFPLAITYTIYGFHFRKVFLEQAEPERVPLTFPDTSPV